MKWDNICQIPVAGTYTPPGISGVSVVNRVRLSGTHLITKERISVLTELFSKPGYTFDDFLLEHRYRGLDDYSLLALMSEAAKSMPQDRRDRFLDVIDGSTLCSTILLDLLPSQKMELMNRLYFCERDEDVWDILLDGYGEPQYFLKGYAGMKEGILPEYERFTAAPRTAGNERLRRFVIYMTFQNPFCFYEAGGRRKKF